ncbi:hypothetical protein [Rhodococcus triatomae]
MLLSVPVAVWIGLATVLVPSVIAVAGYLCALLICPPLDRAIVSVAGS